MVHEKHVSSRDCQPDSSVGLRLTNPALDVGIVFRFGETNLKKSTIEGFSREKEREKEYVTRNTRRDESLFIIITHQSVSQRPLTWILPTRSARSFLSHLQRTKPYWELFQPLNRERWKRRSFSTWYLLAIFPFADRTPREGSVAVGHRRNRRNTPPRETRSFDWTTYNCTETRVFLQNRRVILFCHGTRCRRVTYRPEWCETRMRCSVGRRCCSPNTRPYHNPSPSSADKQGCSDYGASSSCTSTRTRPPFLPCCWTSNENCPAVDTPQRCNLFGHLRDALRRKSVFDPASI